VSNALGDLLSPVDLANLLIEKLVTALAELDNAGALRNPSCKSQFSSLRVTRSSQTSARESEASLRTGNFLKDLLGDIGGNLVLGQGVGVRERVVYRVPLALLCFIKARLKLDTKLHVRNAQWKMRTPIQVGGLSIPTACVSAMMKDCRVN
jgi:hypothetical protein